ncbi:MAG: TetR/AcrR family transcriptional regulator [Pseudomonadales bacterium]|nr:TetR/AcrR family transcriptional regulator [Pseudomonadales bacterium]
MTSVSEKTIEKVKNAMLSCLETQPLHKVSIKTIAENAGISRQSIYNYFPSKEKIFSCLFDDLLDELMEEIEPVLKNFDENSSTLISRLGFSLVQENADMVTLLFNADADHICYDRLRHHALRWMGNIARNHGITIDDPGYLEYAVEHVTGSGYHVMKRWLANGMPYTPEEMSKIHSHLMSFSLLQGMMIQE